MIKNGFTPFLLSVKLLKPLSLFGIICLLLILLIFHHLVHSIDVQIFVTVQLRSHVTC